MRWGLIPAWVKNPKEFATLINARSETAAEKPSFRAALRYRRCLVPTDGFYEWTGARGSKQPHLIRMADRALFALAGLFETWLGADGSEIDTMAILTTEANAQMAHIHDRMPVILPPATHEAWLTTAGSVADGVQDFLRPFDGPLEIVAVNRRLNSPKAEGADLQEPASPTLC